MMQIINADDHNEHLLLDSVSQWSALLYFSFFLPVHYQQDLFYTILNHVLGKCTYLCQVEVLLQDTMEGFLISGALPSQEEEI
jgi:hypothetical protein